MPDDESTRDDEARARFAAAHLLEWHRVRTSLRTGNITASASYRRTSSTKIDRRSAAFRTKGSRAKRNDRTCIAISFPPQDHSLDRALEVHDPKTQASAGTLVAIDDAADR